MKSLNEGIDFDVINKIVSFNPKHERNVDTGSLIELKPIYDIFIDKLTGFKYKLISVFKRKKSTLGLDGNPFIYALKKESGDKSNKIWKFKSKKKILKKYLEDLFI